MKKTPKHFINELIIDTENAIRHLDEKLQHTYRFPAAKKIKQIVETNSNNGLHKRYRYILPQIKEKLTANNPIQAKADKGRSIVITDWNTYLQKTDELIQENEFTRIEKDPTEQHHKQVQQVIHIRNYRINKHSTQIKPNAPALDARRGRMKDCILICFKLF